MAKTVEIRVDADRSSLSVESGRLFVGTVARVRLDGWIPDDGFDPVLTMFSHDCAAPLAQSRTENCVFVLDLTGAALRRAFCRCPARHQFALYLNQRDHDGRYRPDVDAVGTVYVDWSPEVFDVATGEVATLKGPPGNPGVDGMSAYELAVANGYRGTVLQWLEDLKGAPGEPGAPGDPGAPGRDGISAYEVAVRNGFSGTEAQWLESLRAGVSSIGGKSGDLSLEDIGALAVEKDLPNNRTVAFVAADGADTAKAEMYLNAAGGAEASMHVGDTPNGRGKISVGNGPGGVGVGVFGKTSGNIKVAEHAGYSAVEINGETELDPESYGPVRMSGSIEVRGEGASIKKNGKEVATEEQVAAVGALIGAQVEISGEYEDGSAFSFNVLTKGE